MWMMGYNDGGEFNSIQDSFNSRKLGSLMPRPATAAAACTNPPCLTRINGTDLLTLNQHLGKSLSLSLSAMADQNKRELSTQQIVVSSRWNPTPEQLQTLEELYRRGTRTPSADQIQHITAQLRRYGKIEGKNVFYWFQNHKARERQKRRRQLESPSDEQPHNSHTGNGEKKESSPGANRTVFDVEQSKNWASPINSSTIAEKNVSTQGAAKAADAECKADGWLQFDDEAELQQRRNATWQMMHLSCSSSPTNLINSSSAPTVTTTIPSTVVTMEPNHIKTQDFIDMFVGPYNVENLNHSDADGDDGGGGREAQTLQLFPLGSGGRQRLNEECDDEKEEEEESGAAMNATSNVTPYQFFEFLPLKN
ncbi:hypothetical protein Pfo_011593 [Paulownia fortunei]|nr:hypothetical protein Pfo_011593 [Paulownia fortunei]